jgi:oxygen-independent coproporphyrinogen-3 oxidase
LSGIYIHIPFCRQACHYCNFHFSTSLRKKETLLFAIYKEIEQCKNDGEKIETIYFGGGTPGILSVSEINELLRKIRNHFTIDDDAEITLEANPDDLLNEKLSAWKDFGINRLSIGVQSFFDEDLQWMNRVHNAEQAFRSIESAKKYFDNITIDLIYGVPELSDERWRKNVETALALGIPHLSCYALTVETKTPLAKLIRLHKKSDVNPDHQAEQFLMLMDWMEAAGYEHYEISNFAKPNRRSRHNTAYWQGKKYFGFGPSAHSYNGKERIWNIANNQKYIDAIAAGTIFFEKETLTKTQQFNEYIMTSLRTIEGINLKKLNEADVRYLMIAAQKFFNQLLMQQSDDRLFLTRKGKLFADGIAAELFRN